MTFEAIKNGTVKRELACHHDPEGERPQGSNQHLATQVEIHRRAAALSSNPSDQLRSQPLQFEPGWDDDEDGLWRVASKHDLAWFWGTITIGILGLAGSLYACYRWLV